MNEKPKKQVKLHSDTIKALKDSVLSSIAGGCGGSSGHATCLGDSTICWTTTINCATET